jgi:hypothetical protein
VTSKNVSNSRSQLYFLVLDIPMSKEQTIVESFYDRIGKHGVLLSIHFSAGYLLPDASLANSNGFVPR